MFDVDDCSAVAISLRSGISAAHTNVLAGSCEFDESGGVGWLWGTQREHDDRLVHIPSFVVYDIHVALAFYDERVLHDHFGTFGCLEGGHVSKPLGERLFCGLWLFGGRFGMLYGVMGRVMSGHTCLDELNVELSGFDLKSSDTLKFFELLIE